MFEAEGALAGAQAPEIQEPTVLLVLSREWLGIVAFFKAAREICLAIEIVLFNDVFSDERHTKGFDDMIGVHTLYGRTRIELAVRRVPPLDIVLETRALFGRQVRNRSFDANLRWVECLSRFDVGFGVIVTGIGSIVTIRLWCTFLGSACGGLIG